MIRLRVLRQKAFRIYLLNLVQIVLLLTIPASVLPSASIELKAQPLLLELAAIQPDAMIRVIVQQRRDAKDWIAVVNALGGRVIRHLNFIKAFVAELPAGIVPTLAQEEGVHYISLDGAMRNTADFTAIDDWATTADSVNWNIAKQAQTLQSTSDATFITWATALGTASAIDMVNAHYLVDEVGLGADGYYGYHTGNGKAAFTGFEAEVVPGHAIRKVEVVFPVFVNLVFSKDLRIKTYVGGSKRGETRVKTDIFQDVVGAAKAGLVYVDITGTNTWRWGDFQNDLQIAIETSGMSGSQTIYYDALGLRVTSTPGIDATADMLATTGSVVKDEIDTSKLFNVFPFVVRAPEVWNSGPAYLQGQAMTIAVVDSGIAKTGDLKGRNVKDINFNEGYHDSKDRYGHGTFVASMIAGDGKKSDGAYLGIAPQSQLLNVRVSDDLGMAYESDVVAGLQWIYENKRRYNIRVVNLSLNSSIAISYHLGPLNAAVELLWLNGVVIVVAAGNNGTAELFPPANDPFVITVGATDDRGTKSLADDVVGQFSAFGITLDGYPKPDLVAPGKNIVMYLPGNNHLTMGNMYRSHQVNNDYFRMSGTSMAAPIVAGAAALLLQDEPTLTPDQVKYRLMATANKNWPSYDSQRAGAGYVDIYAAVHGTTNAGANTGIPASQLLWTDGSTAAWNSVSWNSVSWNSVSWNSVSWNSDYWDTEAVAASAFDKQLNAQGLPIPINVGQEEATVSDQEQAQQLYLPLIRH